MLEGGEGERASKATNLPSGGERRGKSKISVSVVSAPPSARHRQHHLTISRGTFLDIQIAHLSGSHNDKCGIIFDDNNEIQLRNIKQGRRTKTHSFNDSFIAFLICSAARTAHSSIAAFASSP